MDAERARQSLTGGCQCGAVRYRLDAEPSEANICHCRMCQKAGGAPFMAFAGVPVKDFVVTHGEIAAFVSSDIAERGYCKDCGTPLTYRGTKAAHISVTIGSLDDPNAIAPTSQLGVESKLNWLANALSLPATTVAEWMARKKIAAIRNRQHPDHEI